MEQCEHGGAENCGSGSAFCLFRVGPFPLPTRPLSLIRGHFVLRHWCGASYAVCELQVTLFSQVFA